MLAGLGVEVPLTVTLEQVTYFAPPDPAPYAAMPLWIWMDEPSYYGFPCYGEPTVKAAQDCGGPPVDPDDRTTEPDPEMRDRLAAFMGSLLPGSGEPVRSLRCQYTLTPDRDFVLAPVPGPRVGGGRARARPTASSSRRPSAGSWPTWPPTGTTSSDVSAFGFDRPGLTDPDFAPELDGLSRHRAELTNAAARGGA